MQDCTVTSECMCIIAVSSQSGTYKMLTINIIICHLNNYAESHYIEGNKILHDATLTAAMNTQENE